MPAPDIETLTKEAYDPSGPVDLRDIMTLQPLQSVMDVVLKGDASGPALLLEELRKFSDGYLRLFKDGKLQFGKQGMKMQVKLSEVRDKFCQTIADS